MKGSNASLRKAQTKMTSNLCVLWPQGHRLRIGKLGPEFQLVRDEVKSPVCTGRAVSSLEEGVSRCPSTCRVSTVPGWSV